MIRVWQARRIAIWMGIMSLGGSFCWFAGFTLANAAYVSAVGQVEVIFSIMAATLFFRERISLREIIGMILISGSVILLVLFL